MDEGRATWLDRMLAANAAFTERTDLERIPVDREPSPYMVMTCMDPRVNLDCIGIPPFTDGGVARSPVRIVRTIGAMSEPRSLVIGLFLAGIEEVAIVMHSDCGCCLAHARLGTIIENLETNLDEGRFAEFRAEIGEPFERKLAAWLKVFDDPRAAVRREAAYVKSLPFVPPATPVHGLVYDLATARIEAVVDGYG